MIRLLLCVTAGSLVLLSISDLWRGQGFEWWGFGLALVLIAVALLQWHGFRSARSE